MNGRRKVLLASLATAGLSATSTPSIAQRGTVRLERYDRFVQWIRKTTPPQAGGMVHYMSPPVGKQQTLSTVASAYVLLLHLRMGNIDAARLIGDALVNWHRESLGNTAAPVRGGLPSEFNLKSGRWTLGDYYYANDNLLAIAALTELHAVTKVDRYALSAVLIGRWMERSLFDGKRLGLWAKNYGPAMQFIRTDGAANNAIHTGMDFLWLSALAGLHRLDPERGWIQRQAEGTAFYAQSMAPEGCWYDHFKPHKPDHPAGSWHWYRDSYVTIGDNTIRSAMAATHFGFTEQVRKFSQWLKPPGGTWLWGYVDPASGGPRYLEKDIPYFDVVCTGLLKAWYRKTGKSQLANRCEDLIAKLQAPNGGWYWGLREKGMKPLNNEQATIVGCWALADIHP